ncbi:MAG: hypothetical protein HY660_06305 [Armatimonadetes bacterium]|nr:hypothetical protein [Armatimonadota bacterium]
MGAPAPAAPGTAPDPEEWLRLALTAPSRTTYQGQKTVIQWSGRTSHAAVVRVYHRPPAQTRIEYLASGARSQRLVIDDGRSRWYYDPARRLAVREISSGTDGLPPTVNLHLLRRNYILQRGGVARVAGREAVQLGLQPRYPGRPLLRLWIDRETGLILRLERFDGRGHLEQLSTFTRVAYTPDLPAHLFAWRPPAGTRTSAAPSAERVPLDRLAARLGFPPLPLTPAQIPAGFVLESTALLKVGRAQVGRLHYTDGLATLTVFQGRVAVVGGGRGRTADAWGEGAPLQEQGGVRALSWQAHGRMFTLVSDLAPSEVLRIARGLGYNSQARSGVNLSRQASYMKQAGSVY